MSDSKGRPGPHPSSLDGSRSERIAELVALAASKAPPDAAVLARVLELAGQGTGLDPRGEADAVAVKEERRRLADVLTRACSDPSHATMVESQLEFDPFVRRWICAFALARAGRRTPEVWDVAVEALGEPDGDVRWAAAEILCGAGSEAVPLVVRAASDEDPLRRKMSLYCMRDLGVREMGVVYDALRSEDAGVRLAALAAAASLAAGEPRATRETVRCLSEDTDPGVRRAAAAVLGRLHGDVPAALAALHQAAADAGDPHLQRAVSGALRRLRAG